jgi:hypothetical protein
MSFCFFRNLCSPASFFPDRRADLMQSCGARHGNPIKSKTVFALATLLAGLAAISPASAQNPPQSAGWKGANNVIAEHMWGNGTTRNYTGTQQDVTDAANAGIRWSRFVVYTPPDNTCTDPEMQHLVAMQRANGINIMLDIQRLASSGTSCSGTSVTQTPYDPVNNPNDGQYKNWLAGIVNQYKPYIHFYEIGNEENGTGDWSYNNSQPSPTRDAAVGGCTTTTAYRNGVANYVLFLKDTYNTIKANDPAAKVIIGGLSEWTEECFIDELAANQAWLYMDYMALHPYGACPTGADCNSYPSSLERLQSYQTHLAAWPSPYNGIGTWITEIGYYNKRNDPTWTLVPQAPDPATEATWLVNEMTMLHSNGITTPIFWYNLHEESSCDVGFGLTMRNNGSGKCATDTYEPVYTSFQGIADPASDLVISATPFWPVPTVTAGGSAVYNISVSDVSGFTGGNVTLNLSGLPSGATGTFSPNPVSPGSSSTLSISTSSSTSAGNYALTIAATDSNTASGNALNAQITLAVNPGTSPDFSISATPSSQTVPVGGSTTYTTSISTQNGFTGAVSLSVSGLPSGATGSFNPTSISGGSGNSTLTVTTASTTATGSYTLTITGASGGLTHSMTVTLVLTTSTATPVYQINSGGPSVAPFAADAFFSAGRTASTTTAISTSGVSNAAPMAVYQTERWGGDAKGNPAPFSYTFSNLTAGATCTVRLHFAEIYWTSVGQRIFNVAINGSQVLANFDIIAAAGGANKANVQQFTTTANSSGQIAISFTVGTADAPKVSGIEVQ